MLSVFNREMGEKLAVHYHENGPESVSEPQQCTIQDAEENMAELVKIMVKNLAKRTAVVCSSCLLAVNSV
jgi:hypothetical protein